MAGFPVWFRHLFVKPRPMPLRPSLSPAGTILPERPGSFGRDLDEVVVGAEASIGRAGSLTASAAEHNAFAIALYDQLYRQGGNQFFSPFSIRTALAMTYAGARGETAAQMRKALRMAASDEAQHTACADIVGLLSAARGAGYEVAVANSLWSQVGTPLEPAFVHLIGEHYRGSVNLVDFHRDPDSARATMNQWVTDRTSGKIRDVLGPGFPHPDTRLVLINAVYFKATWAMPFDKDLTRGAPFLTEDGGEVEVPMMQQLTRVGYVKGPDYQAIQIPYLGGDFAMLVVLPDRKDGLRDLEAALSAPMLSDCLQSLVRRKVEIFLPRFKIAWGTADLVEPLTRLGMRLAFRRYEADFSGINGREPPREDSLFVSAILHKAVAEVNEEGTEAAAATAITTLLAGIHPPPVPTFRADHPFLFAIYERKSGAVFFLGRMVDPRRQS